MELLELNYQDWDGIDRFKKYEIIKWNVKTITVKEVGIFRDDHGGQAWGRDIEDGEVKRLKLIPTDGGQFWFVKDELYMGFVERR